MTWAEKQSDGLRIAELNQLKAQRRADRIRTIERAITDIQAMRDQDVPAGQRDDSSPEYSEAVTKLRTLLRLQ